VGKLSTKIRTVPLLSGRLENGRFFKGTDSEKPFSLRVKEFMRFNNSAQDLTLTI
jgi:hypothetical protein